MIFKSGNKERREHKLYLYPVIKREDSISDM